MPLFCSLDQILDYWAEIYQMFALFLGHQKVILRLTDLYSNALKFLGGKRKRGNRE
jgi:hypothetical protein